MIVKRLQQYIKVLQFLHHLPKALIVRISSLFQNNILWYIPNKSIITMYMESATHIAVLTVKHWNIQKHDTTKVLSIIIHFTGSSFIFHMLLKKCMKQWWWLTMTAGYVCEVPLAWLPAWGCVGGKRQKSCSAPMLRTSQNLSPIMTRTSDLLTARFRSVPYG